MSATRANGECFSPDYDFWERVCKLCVHGGDDPHRCDAFSRAHKEGAVGCLRIIDGEETCTQFRSVGKPQERQVTMDL